MIEMEMIKRRKRGRPKSANPRLIVTIRMTKAEKQAATKAARQAGLTLTDYLLAPARKRLAKG